MTCPLVTFFQASSQGCRGRRGIAVRDQVAEHDLHGHDERPVIGCVEAPRPGPARSMRK